MSRKIFLIAYTLGGQTSEFYAAEKLKPPYPAVK